MKICLFISSLASGGAERVITILAGEWAERGNEVVLITIKPESEDFYSISPKVKRITLNIFGASKNPLSGMLNNFRRVMALREAVRRESPDALISFMDKTNVLALIATRKLPVSVYVSERNDPRPNHTAGRATEVLRRVVYPWAKAVVVQTRSVEDWAIKNLPGSAIKVIPNPARKLDKEAGEWKERPPGAKIVAALGSLTPQKGFDRLLSAFERCRGSNPEWILVIVGDGPLREDLQRLAEELNISSAVMLVGKVKKPEAILKCCDMFVMSSLYEGFPNALMEAMGCGLPAVSFDCQSGPSDLIEHGKNGLLVPPGDTDALAATMAELMNNESLRKTIGEAATQVINTFSTEMVMNQWDEVIGNSSNRREAP